MGQGPEPHILVSIIFISLFTIICSVSAIVLFWQLFCGETSRIHAVTKWLIFLCVIVSTLCEWADLSRHVICSVIGEDNLYFYPMNNIMGGADFLYYLGGILFYVIALSRLQISFHGSQYAIPWALLSFFYTLIGMQFIHEFLMRLSLLNLSHSLFRIGADAGHLLLDHRDHVSCG